MRIIGVKISIHITNFTLIVIHIPFAAKSKFYVIIVYVVSASGNTPHSQHVTKLAENLRMINLLT